MQHYDIASELAAVREELGVTLPEISRRTNIQLESLQKLESGCYDFLPPFYVRQIVRKYAEALNIPADTIEFYLKELDARFSAQSSAVQTQQTQQSAPLLSDDRLERLAAIFSPARLAFFGVAILALGIGVGAFYFYSRSADAEVIHKTGAPVTSAALEKPEPPKPAESKIKPLAPPPTLDVVSGATSAAPSSTLRALAAEETAKKKLSLVIRAKSDCWVGVVADERKVQEAYLRANESSHFEADSLVKLTLGKVEVAEVWLNGKSIELPKRIGAVSNLRFSLKDVTDHN